MPLLILIAEDDPGLRLSIHDYLELNGYSVIAAADGEEALLMLEKYHPHLLISDIKMPARDGYELVKEIRQLPQYRLLPVIFLTEHNSTEARIRGYQAGCDIYLPKPFEMEELSAVIRNLLERSQIIHSELRFSREAKSPGGQQFEKEAMSSEKNAEPRTYVAGDTRASLDGKPCALANPTADGRLEYLNQVQIPRPPLRTSEHSAEMAETSSGVASSSSPDPIEALEVDSESERIPKSASLEETSKACDGRLRSSAARGHSSISAVRETSFHSPPNDPLEQHGHGKYHHQSQIEHLHQQLELTNREREVLALLINGFSNVEIGSKLHLSHRTIEKYVSSLLRKTETNNRIELIRLILEYDRVEFNTSQRNSDNSH